MEICSPQNTPVQRIILILYVDAHKNAEYALSLGVYHVLCNIIMLVLL